MREFRSPASASMVRVPAGGFRMGSDEHYEEERPQRRLDVDTFDIDATPVTNRAFAAFAKATGYRTVAERRPDPAHYPGVPPQRLKAGAMVFRQPRVLAERHWSQWWAYVPGAYWLKPEGKSSVFRDRLDHPVVCVAFEDALAYAFWAGKDLPTEAEWEYAARGGLDGARFVWGEVRHPDGRHMANTWTGDFPTVNLTAHGYSRTSPVGSFPPNGYGLSDMTGNIWEWTKDFYSSAPQSTSTCCSPALTRKEYSFDPDLPGLAIPRRVVKGGSHLCHESYCDRYRPAARQPQMEDTATTHIGFRCVLRP